MSPRWQVIAAGRDLLDIAGPAVDDFAQAICEGIADSIHAGDTRATAWTDYVLARHLLLAAQFDDGADLDELEALDSAAAVAWDALERRLSPAIRLHRVEAQIVAELLDDHAGRIGTVTP